MRFPKFLQIAALILLAAGAQPAYSAFWQWSKTAATNSGADPTINWSEGMSPSSVNDSARAMMARAAEYRDDISGALALAGTATAYTLTTNQGLNATPVTGQMLAFVPNVTNGTAPTLTVDGGNTYPLQITAGTALPAGSIVAGTPYRASFTGTAWVMEGNYGNPYAVPLGAFLHSTVATPPNANFITPIGQCISTTTYAAYWVAIGSPASGACPGGQFAVVDVRGRNLTALDTLSASAANRLTVAATGCGTDFTTMGATCLNGSQSKTILTANLPPYSPAGTANVLSSLTTFVQTSSLPDAVAAGGATGVKGVGSATATITQVSSSGPVTGTPQGGSSTPAPTLDPNLGVYIFLRVI